MASFLSPMLPDPVPPRRSDAPVAALLGAALLVVYGLGACRTIYVGDSGELVAAVHLLGVPHPSGYPLYVLLGKIWTLAIPAGSVAFRMSLFSAVCAAAACSVLYLIGRRLGAGALPSLFGAGMLAFGPSFWGEANIQRTYALNALLLLLATWAALRWLERRTVASLALAFALAGVGASNHLYMIVFALCLAGYALLTEPSLARRPSALAAAGGFLAGLLPYLYLPLRSRAQPPLDWGNPETARGFLDVVSRRSFWERVWIEKPSDIVVIAADYLKSLGSETLWVGVLLALAGAVVLARRPRFALLPLAAMAANLLLLAAHGSRTDIFIWHRYYIPSYAMAALLAAAGCHLAVRRLPLRVGFLALAAPIVLLATGWGVSDRSRYRIAEDFSGTLLRSLPPGSHLIASDDNILFTTIYLHLVEGVRPDVDLVLQGVGTADLPPLRFNPDTDAVFLTHHPNWRVPALEIVPVGLAFRAWRAGRPWPDPVLPAPRLDGEEDPRVPKDYLTSNLIGHFHYMLGVTFEERDWLRARDQFAAAAEAAPDNDVLFYNLGLIYRRNGLLDEAREAFARCRAINPRGLSSPSRPRAADRIAEIEADAVRVRAIDAAAASDPALRDRDPGSAAWHLGMALILDARGEVAASRAHRLRALERGAAEAPPR